MENPSNLHLTLLSRETNRRNKMDHNIGMEREWITAKEYFSDLLYGIDVGPLIDDSHKVVEVWYSVSQLDIRCDLASSMQGRINP